MVFSALCSKNKICIFNIWKNIGANLACGDFDVCV